MSTIVTRAGKGASLSWTEADANFTNLNTDKAELSALSATTGSSLVGFSNGQTGAVSQTVQTKLREVISVADFGAVGDGSVNTTNMYTYLTAAWDSAIANEHDLFFPAGTYDVGINNMPFRQGAVVSLLDCKNITLFGEGPASILKTSSVTGADVLQLNGLKNLHIRDFQIQATISGSTSGSNAISITNGFDNITIDNVYCYNLPSLDATTYVDGGKALSIQSPTSAVIQGTLRAKLIAEGCAEGFGFEPDLVYSQNQYTGVEVDLIARNCYIGVKIAAAAASAAVSANMFLGTRVRAQVINCQHGVILQRAHGVVCDATIQSTKTAAAKRLNPSSVAWRATETVVDALDVRSVKNSKVRLSGNAGSCDYKIQIGGIAAGSSGLSGACQYSTFDVDVVGTAATSNLNVLNVGGNTCSACEIFFSSATMTDVDVGSELLVPSNANNVRVGAVYNGSYTGTLTGCTTSPTGAIEWSLNGSTVVIQIPTITATSNATSCTITGMPANLRPSSDNYATLVTTDNGTDVVSRAVVASTGTITLYNGVSATFTNSGTKGVQVSTISYSRV